MTTQLSSMQSLQFQPKQSRKAYAELAGFRKGYPRFSTSSRTASGYTAPKNANGTQHDFGLRDTELPNRGLSTGRASATLLAALFAASMLVSCAPQNMRSQEQIQAADTTKQIRELSSPNGGFDVHVGNLLVSASKPAGPRAGKILDLTPLTDRSELVVVFENGLVALTKAPFSHFVPVARFSFPPEGVVVDPVRGLAVASRAHELELLDLRRSKPIASLTRLETRVSTMAFQPGKDAVLLGGVDGLVYRWRYLLPDPKKSLERYFGAGNIVSAVAAHTGGRVFFSGDWSGGLHAWLPYDEDPLEGAYDRTALTTGAFADRATRKSAQRADRVVITHLLVSPDGKSLFVALEDGRVEWWFIQGFLKLGEVKAHAGRIYDAELSADGQHLATTGRDGIIHVFELRMVDGAPPTVSFEARLKTDDQGSAAIAFVSASSVVVDNSRAMKLSILSFN